MVGAGRCWSMRYGGHQNRETVKDVAFVGPHDEVVAAGSDNGCMYLWDRTSGAWSYQARAFCMHMCVPFRRGWVP